MNTEFIQAIEELEKEKEISKEVLFEAIESALVSAYKKNYTNSQNVRVSIDRELGHVNVYRRMDIVEVVEDPAAEVSLEYAQSIDPAYELGDVIEYQVTPRDFGRIAAQTAKQVVVQRIREAERGLIYDRYISRQGEIINGVIHRISNDTIFITMNRTEGILSVNEQVKGERYTVNSRIKVYIMDVKKTTKGPQVYLSRSHPGLVKRLFELEVPEIQEGVVTIQNIIREAGSRSKMAVSSIDDNVDPIGACIGNKGMRINRIVEELHGERIDIVKYSDDLTEYVRAALSPANVISVELAEGERAARVIVAPDQLSLAIGKEGQNARLAARLTGCKIDIKTN